MEQKMKRYADLKERQRLMEQELSQLRSEIVAHLEEVGEQEQVVGKYRARLVQQERREYQDELLYEALQDKQLWRLASRADNGKISSLLKLQVLTEQQLAGTYTQKHVRLLQVDKR